MHQDEIFQFYVKLNQNLSETGRIILSNVIYFDSYFQSGKTENSEVENIENSFDSSIRF